MRKHWRRANDRLRKQKLAQLAMQLNFAQAAYSSYLISPH
jgi:hypothetical protein